MAFSPFNIFRRNQRAIFAVITVFIMFTFVLSSGLGGGADFFDWFPRWLGGSGKRGAQICTIDGDRIYERDLREVQFQRAVANQFMMYASELAGSGIQRDIQEKLVQATPMTANMVRSMMKGEANPQFVGPLLAQLAMSPNAPAQDKALVNLVRAWMQLEQHRRMAAAGGGTYFLNAPNRTGRDAVDFLLWERKADRFGIAFTDDDVKQLVRGEFFGQFTNDVEVRSALQRNYGGRATPGTIYRALAAEFKVRTAQTALLGTGGEGERTASFPPIFTTPYDLFTFYQDKASPATYDAIAVPAAGFAAQVKAEPTDAEVQRLFAERKDYEPDPSRPEPGFKEPRKVKVEWVGATGDEPYYKKAAADWIARTELFARGGIATLTVPVPGVGATWAAAALAPGSLTDPLVYPAYRLMAESHEKQDLAYRWGNPSGIVLPNQVLSSSYLMWSNRAPRTKDDNDKKRPVYAAGPELAAQWTALGTAAIGGNPFLQPSAFYAQAVAHEVRDRGTSGALLFLAGVPGPGMLQTVVGAEAAYRRSLPKPLPVEAVRADLLSSLAEVKARDLAVADLRKLQAEMVKLSENGRPKDRGAAAGAYAAAFAKERGLTLGATPEAVSEWTVRDEPALAPLREAFQKGGSFDPHTGMAVPFGQRFFSSLDPRRGTRVTATGLYVPEFYPERAADTARSTRDAIYLAWRTEDQAAKGVPLAAARPRVVEAWKLAKGREEAKAAAEQIAAQVRNAPGTSPAQFEPVLRDLEAQLRAKFADPKAKDRVKLFKVENVAPIQVLNDFNGMARPFTLLGNPNIPFPTNDMSKQLLDHRTDPAKTTFVVADAPKDVYYVFTLTGRQERGVEEFRQHRYAQEGRGQVFELLMMMYGADARDRTRDSVLALLKKEFDYQETDEQKAKLDEQDKKREE